MTRFFINFTVQTPNGDAVNAARVYLFNRDSSPASLWAADTGGSPLDYVVTDARGWASGYVPPGRYLYDVVVNGMALISKRPYDVPSAGEDVGTAAAPRVIGALATSLGAAQMITFTGPEEVWLLGTADQASLVVTLASRVAGARCRVVALHDGTTSARAISFSDGTTPQQVVTSSVAGELLIVEADCPDATEIGVYSVGGSGPQGPSGQQGLQGLPGTPGAPGTPGTDGAAGANATISTVKDEGSALPPQANLNFTGDGVTVTNNAVTGATDVAIPGGGGGGTAGDVDGGTFASAGPTTLDGGTL